MTCTSSLVFALVWAPLAGFGCGEERPIPPAGSGIRAPVVAADTPADFAFRWPSPARARVTLRTGIPDRPATSALACDIELAAPDAQGWRRLQQSEWRAVGGHAVDLMVFAMNHASRADGLMVGGDGQAITADPSRQWDVWTAAWTRMADVAEGAEKVFPRGTPGVPDGVTYGLTRGGASSLSPSALKLVMRMTAESSAGREALGQLLGQAGLASAMTGETTGLRYVADVDPRTLQPLRVEVIYQFERKALALTYEFDWDPLAAK